MRAGRLRCKATLYGHWGAAACLDIVVEERVQALLGYPAACVGDLKHQPPVWNRRAALMRHACLEILPA